MFKEFKNFILTGNVIDFAVAIIMAGAVGLVVTGFVSDIVMPLVGLLTGGMDLSDNKWVLTAAVGKEGDPGYTPENAILWGKWIGTILNLIIVGFVMFLIVKAYNKFRTQDAAPPTTEELLTQIRDILEKEAKN